MTMALTHTVSDSLTMWRRQLTHLRRYPSLTFLLAGMPVIFLLLFVYVFGGTLGDGLGAGLGIGSTGGGRSAYVDYVVPGILLMTIASAAQGTAISVATDATEGIVDRFRTMAIARSSVLTGHVLGSMLQAAFSLVLVLGVAFAVGFRPTAGLLAWLAAVGVLLAITFAFVWLCVALGLASGNVETASNVPMPLMLLPFLGSGFVPTDSMPAWLAAFADHQPFTPMIEALRGLLLGTPIGGSVALTLAWSAGIALVGYLWARRRFTRAAR